MSCFASQGFSLGCDTGVGGISKIYVVGGDGEVTGFTENVDQEITGFTTSTTGTTLYEYELKRGLSSLTQNINKSYDNGTLFFEQVLTVVLHKMDKDKRNEILLLGTNDALQVIAVDGNQVQYYLGAVNGLTLSGTASTGAALADRNGFELVFTGQEPAPSHLINGDIDTVWPNAIS